MKNKSWKFKSLESKNLGSILIIFVISFCIGFNLLNIRNVANADETSVLPVNKGGTGNRAFPQNSVLLGNGQNSLTTINIDSNRTINSNNLISSGGVFSAANVNYERLNRTDVITLNDGFKFWDHEGTTVQNPYIVKQGNIIFIAGPIEIRKDIPAKTNTAVFTFNSGYKAHSHATVICSNNFSGSMQTINYQCSGATQGTGLNIYLDQDFTYDSSKKIFFSITYPFINKA
ncbi:MAG: hypothetical protein LBT91_01905 [Bifidobacteriaceae bacterium]|jgi:hypothetical protein|nr:hypothetical protein [Bifidobacteriaceae bacterium]